MATVNFYQAVNMNNASIYYGYVTSYSSSHVTITDYNGKSGTYYGTSFSFNTYGLTGGTVTGYDGYKNYQHEFTLSGASLSAITVNSYLTSGNIIGFQQYVFSGADTINGSAYGDYLLGWGGNDQLYGGNGSDTLDGGDGADLMVGGMDNDTYIVNDLGDQVYEYSGQGEDLINSSVSYSLSTDVENLTLLGVSAINGTGNALNNILIGNDAANTLLGGLGYDTLNGGAGADVLIGGMGDDSLYGGNGSDTLDGSGAADLMVGGMGNDTYIVNDLGDQVYEYSGQGQDLINSSVSYSLSTDVENLTLLGVSAINGTGNTLNNVLIGNDAANTLLGDLGDDTLNGGAGADVLIGGMGNDTYKVDNSSDVVTESQDEGIDLIKSTVSYSLSADVENLTLIGVSAISGTGNTLDNVLIGNDAANTLLGDLGNDILNGGGGNDTLDGGTGDDAMTGGLGGDTYIVDSVADTTIELAGAGFDTVNLAGTFADTSYTLASNVEGLNGSLLTDMTLIGNIRSNTITGGAGNDTLNGGIGSDLLNGGDGDDTYIVDTAAVANIDPALVILGDRILDTSGTDTVQSSVSWTLAAVTASPSLENLTLTGVANINGTGNTLDNVITGNNGNNTLNGAAGNDTINGGVGSDKLIGGAGNDVLTGGAGADKFTFNTALSDTTNVDTILDFNVTDDSIQLSQAIFTKAGVAGSNLTAAAFYTGTAAHDASDRIIFDVTTGDLYYDKDGNGLTAAVKFAHIDIAGLVGAVTEADFSIIV